MISDEVSAPPQFYVYIYMCVCVCVYIYIHMVMAGAHKTHLIRPQSVRESSKEGLPPIQTCGGSVLHIQALRFRSCSLLLQIAHCLRSTQKAA